MLGIPLRFTPIFRLQGKASPSLTPAHCKDIFPRAAALLKQNLAKQYQHPIEQQIYLAAAGALFPRVLLTSIQPYP
jgi:hypothetical protein